MLIAVTLVMGSALLLVAALALGWNSPRPGGPPDWEAPALPERVVVAPEKTYVALLDHRASDLTFEVIAAPLDGPASGFYNYGLVYRAQDASHYYAFAVGSDGYFGIVEVDGETKTPLVTWQQFPHIARGRKANRLLVSCAGASCSFRINDEYAATVEDASWLTGDVGLWALSLKDEAVIQFRRAGLWRGGAGVKGPALRTR